MKQAAVIGPLAFLVLVLILPMMFLIFLMSDLSEARPAGGYPESIPGIGPVVLWAYYTAEANTEEVAPGCQGMTWTLIAAIGYVETRHATVSAADEGTVERIVDENGDVEPPIYGIDLDGSNRTRKIKDTDGGKWDGKDDIDRAVGPMQFIPSTWESYRQDGNDDGEKDPQNVFDASFAAVLHLCRSGGNDLTTESGMKSAIKGYNQSDEYVNDVLNKKEEYDRHHVDVGDLAFSGGEIVGCGRLGQVREETCYLHDHLNGKFGAFYLDVGGYRNEMTSDHGHGEAIDYMVAPLGGRPTPERDAMALLVVNHLIRNHKELSIKGIIYNYHIWSLRDPVGDWHAVRRHAGERGSHTQNHVDHIHVSVGPPPFR